MNTAFLKQLGSQPVAPYPLSATEVTIGRDPSCQLVLDSALYTTVSRRHASIRPIAQSNSFEICDLGSANGTFVNGQRLQGCQQLRSGDRLQFGTNGPEFTFEDSSAPPRYASSDPANAHPNQALPPTVISSSPPNNYYPPQAANSSGGVGKIIGIVAAVIIGGLLLYFVSQKNTPSSQPETSPSTASSPVSNSPEAPPTTASSPDSNSEVARIGNIKACPSTPSTRGQECPNDIVVFDPSTKEIDFFIEIQNPSPDAIFSAIVQHQVGNVTYKDDLGSNAVGAKKVILLYLTASKGWEVGDYELAINLKDKNFQSSRNKKISIAKSKQ